MTRIRTQQWELGLGLEECRLEYNTGYWYAYSHLTKIMYSIGYADKMSASLQKMLNDITHYSALEIAYVANP